MEFKSEFLKKILHSNAETASPKIEGASKKFDKIQTWIFQHANLVVDTLVTTINKQDINGFFNSKSQLFEEIPVFDDIVRNCFFIRMSNDTIGPKDIQLKATGKSAYILYNDTQLYYIDYYSNLKKISLNSLAMLQIDELGIFPKSLNLFEAASIQNITKLQTLIKHSNSELIDDLFEAYFKDLKEIKSAEKFYKEVQQISHDLFFPIEKSTAWFDFKDQYKISDKIYNLIAVNFTYKLMSFWIKKYCSGEKFDELNLQCFSVISTVAIRHTKELFIKECEDILQKEIKKQISNISKIDNISESEKIKNLQNIKGNIYYKLLWPASHKIFNNEIQNITKILSFALESEESENLKNLTEINQHSLKLRPKSTSFYHSKKARSGNDLGDALDRSDSQIRSSESQEKSKSKRKSASFRNKESTSEITKKTSEPISIPQAYDLKPQIKKTDLIFPFTPCDTKSSENEALDSKLKKNKRSSQSQLATTSLTHREMSQSGRESLEGSKHKQKSKHKPKTEPYYLHYSNQNFLAEKIGEMSTTQDQITFFAVRSPKITSIDMNKEKEGVYSLHSSEPK